MKGAKAHTKSAIKKAKEATTPKSGSARVYERGVKLSRRAVGNGKARAT
jgi:hypothetical protein